MNPIPVKIEPVQPIEPVKEVVVRSYGKYRGTVLNNVDPSMLGRLMAVVPAISLNPLPWALPSVPYPDADGELLTVPPIGTDVWIEFEGGDQNSPIWSGCFPVVGGVSFFKPPNT